jgi:hypothetical protein
VVLLDQGGHDPGRLFVEVYDHAQPPAMIDMAAIEVLTARKRVECSMIGVGYGPEDEVNLVHEVGPAECQMQARAGVEDYVTAFGVSCARVVMCHPRKLRAA